MADHADARALLGVSPGDNVEVLIAHWDITKLVAVWALAFAAYGLLRFALSAFDN